MAAANVTAPALLAERPPYTYPHLQCLALQAHRSASLSSRNYSVLDTAAATPDDTLGIITIEDVIEELIGQVGWHRTCNHWQQGFFECCTSDC